jgi:exonuclease VII large subunit
MERTLELLSPESVLRKGYAIVEKDGKVVKASQLKQNDEIKITLTDGVVSAVVDG